MPLLKTRGSPQPTSKQGQIPIRSLSTDFECGRNLKAKEGGEESRSRRKQKAASQRCRLERRGRLTLKQRLAQALLGRENEKGEEGSPTPLAQFASRRRVQTDFFFFPVLSFFRRKGSGPTPSNC